ncbi:MAG: DNA alkylation repair protein [bacterium]|nr:DNA alkylation repair protein [bacterium]
MAETTKKAAKKTATKTAGKKATTKKKAVVKKAVAATSAAWTFDKLMAELKKLGTAQNVKIYMRHGMVEPLFGGSSANLNLLKKQIKVDHELAVELWNSGNADARYLATMILDPAKLTSKTIDDWAKSQNCYGSCDILAGAIVKTSFAHEKADAWIKSKDEWVGRTGWNLICRLAMDQEAKIADEYFEQLLIKIEKEIHGTKNFTRHAMNMALIGIGSRNAKLRKKAEAASNRIGRVVVDHGETDCKTPPAIPYIEKMWARKKK